MRERKIVIDSNGCWLFRDALTSNGYGAMGKRRAHRVMYEEVYGPIPTGLSVLHKCNVRNCVNPEHLYAGTHSENMKDRVKAGRNQGMLGMKHTEETKNKMRGPRGWNKYRKER
jgi:hypothetical protein